MPPFSQINRMYVSLCGVRVFLGARLRADPPAVPGAGLRRGMSKRKVSLQAQAGRFLMGVPLTPKPFSLSLAHTAGG